MVFDPKVKLFAKIKLLLNKDDEAAKQTVESGRQESWLKLGKEAPKPAGLIIIVVSQLLALIIALTFFMAKFFYAFEFNKNPTIDGKPDVWNNQILFIFQGYVGAQATAVSILGWLLASGDEVFKLHTKIFSGVVFGVYQVYYYSIRFEVL